MRRKNERTVAFRPGQGFHLRMRNLVQALGFIPPLMAGIGLPINAAFADGGGALPAPPSTQQAAQAASPVEMDTITVTAPALGPQQKTELGKLTQATPEAGAVVNRDTIDFVQYVNSLPDLAGLVPGMSLIRNMRIPDGAKNYTDERVDGMRVSYNTNWSLVDQIDMATVDHIDYINGPGSAMNSSFAVGGSINVTTLEPSKVFTARATEQLGTFGLNNSQVNLSGPMLNDTMNYRFSAINMDYAGSRSNDSDHQKKLAYNGAVTFNPTPNSKVTVEGDQMHFDYRLANQLGITQFANNWQQQGNYNGTILYGRSVNDYGTDSIRYQVDIDDRTQFKAGYLQRLTQTTGYGNTGNGQSTFSNTIGVSSEMDRTQQFLLRKDFDFAKSTFYAGYEGYDAKLTSASYNNVYSSALGQQGEFALGSIATTGQSISDEEDRTPFINYEFTPVDKVRVHLGERLDRIYDSIDNISTSKYSINGTDFGKNVFKGGVTYEYTHDQMLWGNISQGLLAPALTALSGSGAGAGSALTAPAPWLAPEVDLTQEIGFRGKLNEEKPFQYDVAIYHTTIQNIAVTRNLTAAEAAALGGGYSTLSYINENAAQLTANGLEAQFKKKLAPKYELGATYTLANARYDNYVSAGGAQNYTGRSYADMPPQHLNMRFDYLPAEHARIEFVGDYISRYYIDTPNSGTYHRPPLYSMISSYALDKNWVTNLQIHNIGNVRYADHVGDFTAGNPSTIYFNTYGNSGSFEPLSIRLSLTYKY